MDGARFDEVARTLSAAASRRTTIVALLSGLFAIHASEDDLGAARKKRAPKRRKKHVRDEGKKNKKKKKKKKPVAPSTPTVPPASPPASPPGPPPPPPPLPPPPANHHCAASKNPAFRAPITKLPDNNVTSCEGINTRRREHIFIERPTKVDGQITWSAPEKLVDFAGAFTNPGLFLHRRETAAQLKDSARQTDFLPAGFDPLNPTPDTVCHKTDAATTPVPDGLVCVKGNASFRVLFEQRVYRPDWTMTQKDRDDNSECAAVIDAYFKGIDEHEGQHVQDSEAVAAWYRAAWEGATFSCYGCTPITDSPAADLVVATSAFTAPLATLTSNVNDQMSIDLNECAKAFHKTHGQGAEPLVCDACQCADSTGGSAGRGKGRRLASACGNVCCGPCDECADPAASRCEPKVCPGGQQCNVQSGNCESAICPPTVQQQRDCQQSERDCYHAHFPAIDRCLTNCQPPSVLACHRECRRCWDRCGVDAEPCFVEASAPCWNPPPDSHPNCEPAIQACHEERDRCEAACATTTEACHAGCGDATCGDTCIDTGFAAYDACLAAAGQDERCCNCAYTPAEAEACRDAIADCSTDLPMTERACWDACDGDCFGGGCGDEFDACTAACVGAGGGTAGAYYDCVTTCWEANEACNFARATEIDTCLATEDVCIDTCVLNEVLPALLTCVVPTGACGCGIDNADLEELGRALRHDPNDGDGSSLSDPEMARDAAQHERRRHNVRARRQRNENTRGTHRHDGKAARQGRSAHQERRGR